MRARPKNCVNEGVCVIELSCCESICEKVGCYSYSPNLLRRSTVCLRAHANRTCAQHMYQEPVSCSLRRRVQIQPGRLVPTSHTRSERSAAGKDKPLRSSA